MPLFTFALLSEKQLIAKVSCYRSGVPNGGKFQIVTSILLFLFVFTSFLVVPKVAFNRVDPYFVSHDKTFCLVFNYYKLVIVSDQI